MDVNIKYIVNVLYNLEQRLNALTKRHRKMSTYWNKNNNKIIYIIILMKA